MIKKRLQDLVIIVTGAGHGFGRAISLRLAGEGAKVISSEVKPEICGKLADEITAAGGTALSVPADVANENDVRNLVKAAVEAYGRLDVMVTNAGATLNQLAVDTTAEEWGRLFEINVLGAFLCGKTAALQMVKQKKGKIINCCGTIGCQGSWSSSAYRATKHAVRGFTQSLAMELAANHVTVNSFCPGIVDSGLWDSIDVAMSDIMGLKKGEAARKLRAAMPLGRLQTQDEVAGLVSCLCSRESDGITGHSIYGPVFM